MNAQVKFVVHYGGWKLNVLDLEALQKWVDSGRVNADSQIEIADTFEIVAARKIQGLRFEGVETFPAPEPVKDQLPQKRAEKNNVANIGKIDPKLDQLLEGLWRSWLMVGGLACFLLATAWGASMNYRNPADTFFASLICGVILGAMFSVLSMGLRVVLEVARKVLGGGQSQNRSREDC
jgi:hypothetical protein